MVYRNSRMKLSAGQLFWREAGDRNPTVAIFLHGSWHDSSQWDGMMEALNEDFHCFAPDLLGFGNSTPTNPSNISIALEAECLHEFLTALNLDSVYLVGHSVGAWIAMDYTLKYPDLVRGVVTISPEGLSLEHWQKYSKFTLWMLAHPRIFGWWLRGLKLLASVVDNSERLEKMQNYWHFFRDFPATCRVFFQRSPQVIRSELLGDRVSELSKPLLILQNDVDERTIIEQSQAYSKLVRHAEYRWIQNGELDSTTRSLRQINREIEEFISRIAASEQTPADRKNHP